MTRFKVDEGEKAQGSFPEWLLLPRFTTLLRCTCPTMPPGSCPWGPRGKQVRQGLQQFVR